MREKGRFDGVARIGVVRGPFVRIDDQGRAPLEEEVEDGASLWLRAILPIAVQIDAGGIGALAGRHAIGVGGGHDKRDDAPPDLRLARAAEIADHAQGGLRGDWLVAMLATDDQHAGCAAFLRLWFRHDQQVKRPPFDAAPERLHRDGRQRRNLGERVGPSGASPEGCGRSDEQQREE